MELNNKEELYGRLDEIQKRRDKGFEEYYSAKKKSNLCNDHLDRKMRYIDKVLDSPFTQTDSKLFEKYEERKHNLKRWQSEEESFSSQIESDWKKLNDILDDDEQNIKDEIQRLELREEEDNQSEQEK